MIFFLTFFFSVFVVSVSGWVDCCLAASRNRAIHSRSSWSLISGSSRLLDAGTYVSGSPSSSGSGSGGLRLGGIIAGRLRKASSSTGPKMFSHSVYFCFAQFTVIVVSDGRCRQVILPLFVHVFDEFFGAHVLDFALCCRFDDFLVAADQQIFR